MSLFYAFLEYLWDNIFHRRVLLSVLAILVEKTVRSDNHFKETRLPYFGRFCSLFFEEGGYRTNRKHKKHPKTSFAECLISKKKR